MNSGYISTSHLVRTRRIRSNQLLKEYETVKRSTGVRREAVCKMVDDGERRHSTGVELRAVGFISTSRQCKTSKLVGLIKTQQNKYGAQCPVYSVQRQTTQEKIRPLKPMAPAGRPSVACSRPSPVLMPCTGHGISLLQRSQVVQDGAYVGSVFRAGSS